LVRQSDHRDDKTSPAPMPTYHGEMGLINDDYVKRDCCPDKHTRRRSHSLFATLPFILNL
jgi:hypothetical protein